jgi:hypothetical protein
MKRKKTTREVQPRASVKAGVALAMALASVWVTSLPGLSDRPTRVWRGYETLLIREDVAPPGALGRVVSALGPGVVSELTAPVSFWNFTGVENVPVDRMDARIDRSDPRHDRVMDALPGYFRASTESASVMQRAGRGGGWSFAYIPARRAAVVDYMRIAAILGLPRHGAWKLAEFDPAEFLVSAAGLLVLAVMLAYPFRKEGRLPLLLSGAGALLWIPFLLPGGVARLALSLLLLAAWFPAVEVFIVLHGWDEKLLREARDPLVRFLAAAGGGLVLLLPASGFSAAALISCAGSLTASVLLVVALALFWGRARRPRRRRKKFDPVPIVRPAADPSRPGPAGFLVAAVAVLIVAAIGFLRSTPVPTPLPVLGARDFSWESLSRLGRQNRAQRLPDVSDLVTHEAFQETLAFGRPWGLPGRDERVYVREYSMNPRSATIVPGMRRVKVFDSAWLGAFLLRSLPGSIERMLVTQRRAMAVAVRGQLRTLLRELPVAVLVMFVFSTWFAWDRRAAPLMKGVLLRLNGTARRDQVP